MRNGLQNSYVSGNSLLFFADRASVAFKADVLTCTLSCQLAASAKGSAFSDMAAWRQRYFNAMTLFGCSIVYRDVQHFPLKADDSVWSCLKERLDKRVSASLIESAGKVMTHLSANADNTAVSLLRDYTVQRCLDECDMSLSQRATEVGQTGTLTVTAEEAHVHNVSIQLGFIDAEAVVNLVLVSFKSRRPIAELPLSELFAQGTVVGDLEVAIISAELDDHRFGYFRQGLIDKLGSRRQTLVIELAEVEP